MNVDAARENLSRANTALGDAWRRVKAAEANGDEQGLINAEVAFMAAKRAHENAERLLVEAELEDRGGWKP